MNKWIIEFILFVVYCVFSISWATTGAVMPQIMTDFHLNVSQAALMTNIILWAKVVGSISTAALSYKIGIKKTYALGCFLIGLSVFIPFVNGYAMLLVIRFLGGFGGAICLIALVPTVTKYFSKEAAPAMNSVNCTSNVIGTIIALVLSVYLSSILGGWKNILAIYGAVILILGILWYSVVEEEEKKTKDMQSTADKLKIIKRAICNRIVWGMIVQYFGAMIMTTFVFTYLPTYYAKYGHFGADSIAHYSTSANAVGILVGALLSPLIKKRGYNFRNWLFYTSIVMAIATFVMLFAKNDILVLACAFITGMSFASWFSFMFALPSEELKDASTTMITYVMALFWLLTFIGASLNSQLIAWTIDATGKFTVGFSYVFALMIIAPIAAKFIFPKKQAIINI